MLKTTRSDQHTIRSLCPTLFAFTVVLKYLCATLTKINAKPSEDKPNTNYLMDSKGSFMECLIYRMNISTNVLFAQSNWRAALFSTSCWLFSPEVEQTTTDKYTICKHINAGAFCVRNSTHFQCGNKAAFINSLVRRHSHFLKCKRLLEHRFNYSSEEWENPERLDASLW